MQAPVTIRSATIEDAAAIADLYNYYILHSTVTFEELPVSAADMQERIAMALEQYAWFIAEKEGQLMGYAYATAWRSRSGYRYAAESTVYVRQGAERQGIGTRLYEELLAALKVKGMHAVVGGIVLPNEASISLHEQLGYHKVAHFKEVGYKFGQWLDVGYWEILLS